MTTAEMLIRASVTQKPPNVLVSVLMLFFMSFEDKLFESLTECIANDHCIEVNKGNCNLNTNACECEEGFVEESSECFGKFNHILLKSYLLISIVYFAHFLNFIHVRCRMYKRCPLQRSTQRYLCINQQHLWM